MSTATTNQRAARIADQLLELIEVSKLNPGDRLPSERQLDRKNTRLNSSHSQQSRMPSSA